MDNIPIFYPDKKQLESIEYICEKILKEKENNVYANTSQLEKESDKLVYQLYNLTPEEIKIIEDSVK